MKINIIALVVACGFLGAVTGYADEIAEEVARGPGTTPLVEVLDSVRQRTGRTFVMDNRVRPDVTTGQLRARDIDYHRLLVVLRNNGLAAVRVGDVTTIVPVDIVRQYPLPVMPDDDASIDDEEWITLVVKVAKAHAAEFVPLVRPLMPREGHITAHPESNTILLVDRAGNARRIAGLIRKMDRETTSQ